jgi:hypothetical protein
MRRVGLHVLKGSLVRAHHKACSLKTANVSQPLGEDRDEGGSAKRAPNLVVTFQIIWVQWSAFTFYISFPAALIHPLISLAAVYLPTCDQCDDVRFVFGVSSSTKLSIPAGSLRVKVLGKAPRARSSSCLEVESRSEPVVTVSLSSTHRTSNGRSSLIIRFCVSAAGLRCLAGSIDCVRALVIS